MFGGYYLYLMYWDAGDKEATNDLIEPKNDNTGVPDNGDDHVEPNKIEWNIYDEGLQLSKFNNKPVMIDF